MKKTILTSFTLIATLISYAQVPSGFVGSYTLDRGTLSNGDPGAAENLSNLTKTGTFSLVTNRTGTDDHAVKMDIGGNLASAQTSIINRREITVSYWVKMDDQINTGKRLLQFYGNYSGQGATGFRMEASFTATEASLSWAGAMYRNGSFRSYSNSATVIDLDDNKWHHLVFRTTESGTNLNVNVFMDNVHITDLDGTITTPNGLGDFIRRNTFTIAPLSNYDGAIDDVRVYYSSLSDADVTKLFNETPEILPNQVYVDINATGNNDGTSWANAYTDLREALFNATDGIEVWVAKGKYIRQNIANRAAVFGWTKDNVKLYGGFAGSETALSQRNWRVNKTILSGDIGTTGNNSDNCYTVITGPIGSSSNVISYGLIDGFVIQDGNANISGSDRDRGAGFLFQPFVSEVEIRNCEFINNDGQFGAAIYAASTSTSTAKLTIDACKFTGNEARFGSGAMLVTNGYDFTIDMTNCLFDNNETRDFSAGDGGNSVVYLQEQGHADIIFNMSNTTIANNTNNGTGTQYYGAVMLFKHNSSSGEGHFNMDNCIVWGNDNDMSVVRHTGGQDLNSVKINNSISQRVFPTALGNLTTSNILYSNPLFTDSANNIFTLQSGSPAIDAGSQTGLTIPTLDLAGNPRVAGTEIDLGCYESNLGVGINDIAFENVSIYPNPTSGFINIDIQEELTSIKIMDISGRTMQVFNPKNTQLDISSFTTGIYFLEIANAKKKSVMKIIKK